MVVQVGDIVSFAGFEVSLSGEDVIKVASLDHHAVFFLNYE